MNQTQQRRVQKMQLYYNASKKYRTRTPKDTGWELKYSIRELRTRPENSPKWYKGQDHESAKEKEPNKEIPQQKLIMRHRNGLTTRKKLGEALTQIYPLRKKQTHPAEPEWVTKLEKCGTEQEIRQLDHAYKKRADLQQETPRRNQKLRRQGKCIRLLQILHAWRQAARYTKKHAPEIQYAKRHIIDITQRSDKQGKDSENKNMHRRRILEYTDWVNGRPSRQTPIRLADDGRRTAKIRNYIYRGKRKKTIKHKFGPQGQ